MAGPIRLRTTIAPGELSPITFDYTRDLQTSDVVSEPTVSVERQEGNADLSTTSPAISSDGKKVSSSIMCPTTSTAGRWLVTCQVTIGAYTRLLTASVIQSP